MVEEKIPKFDNKEQLIGYLACLNDLKELILLLEKKLLEDALT